MWCLMFFLFIHLNGVNAFQFRQSTSTYTWWWLLSRTDVLTYYRFKYDKPQAYCIKYFRKIMYNILFEPVSLCVISIVDKFHHASSMSQLFVKTLWWQRYMRWNSMRVVIMRKQSTLIKFWKKLHFDKSWKLWSLLVRDDDEVHVYVNPAMTEGSTEESYYRFSRIWFRHPMILYRHGTFLRLGYPTVPHPFPYSTPETPKEESSAPTLN